MFLDCLHRLLVLRALPFQFEWITRVDSIPKTFIHILLKIEI